MATKILIKLANRTYPVHVGAGALAALAAQAKATPRDIRLFVLYDSQVFALHGDSIGRMLRNTGRAVVDLVVPSGEKSKSQSTLNRIHSFLLEYYISRSDLIIAVGGGVTSDLVGYAAASVLRGVPWGIVSTTLLGMVDAAVGGKTGINHQTGKNLIGAFWQPRFVLCDTDLLRTLPMRQMVAGLGEVVKYAGLIGQEMSKQVESYVKKGDFYDQRLLEPIVKASVACKADIVARDELDSGARRMLNLGHTFGHAIEASIGYGRLLHGEAVIIGLMAAMELSQLTHVTTERKSGAYKELIQETLRMIPRRKLDLNRVLATTKIDKNRRGSLLNFVLLERPGRPLIQTGIQPSLVRTALARALESYELHGGSNAPTAGR